MARRQMFRAQLLSGQADQNIEFTRLCGYLRSLGFTVSPRELDPGPIQHAATTERPPPGLAVRQNGRLKLMFRRQNPASQAVRGGALCRRLPHRAAGGRWLPVTDVAAARHKVQRAVAVEFRCLIDSLMPFLSGDFSAQAIEEAGEHVGVSPPAVSAHLLNNGRAPFWLMLNKRGSSRGERGRRAIAAAAEA